MNTAVTVLQGKEWADLVTTALLGTDRRPLAERAAETTSGTGRASADPVLQLLDLAAAHRTALQAATPLRRCAAPPTATGERLPPVPSRAAELLTALLARPEPALLNAWLGACLAAGRGVPAEHWSRLGDLAARSTAYDRAQLRQAVGPRGRWFLRQNPRWARLADDPVASRPQPTVVVEHWEEALSLVAGGRLGEQTQEVAQTLAVGVPLSAGRDLLDRLESLDAATGEPQKSLSSPGLRRAVDRALGLIRRTVATRLEIDESFRDETFRHETFRHETADSYQASEGSP